MALAKTLSAVYCWEINFTRYELSDDWLLAELQVSLQRAADDVNDRVLINKLIRSGYLSVPADWRWEPSPDDRIVRVVDPAEMSWRALIFARLHWELPCQGSGREGRSWSAR